MNFIFDPQVWIALLTLTSLEIVLGIDNIIFISILASRLPAAQQAKARAWGLGLAMGMRILLLLSISWIIRLTEPFISVADLDISGRDLVLIVGGLFLLAKSTMEIHHKLEGEEESGARVAAASFAGVIIQIGLLDIVFSLDSVITAVGMTNNLPVMVIAVVLAVAVMMFFAGPVSDFVHRHPTVKMLALSFLLLIGVMLLVEGFHGHIPKGYIYFAMAFSFMVEMLNLKLRRVSTAPVHLRDKLVEGPPQAGS